MGNGHGRGSFPDNLLNNNVIPTCNDNNNAASCIAISTPSLLNLRYANCIPILVD